MSNPFENSTGTFLVLRNAAGQYSLWPSFVRVPDGWDVVVEETDKATCLEYITSVWPSLQPVAAEGR